MAKYDGTHEMHGMTGTPEYRSWNSMHQRCYDENHPYYHKYGGKGVTICARWNSFQSFYDDMGPRPDGTSLDRINPYGNYEPGNCRWATRKQQANNTRGSESISSMAKKCGLNPVTVRKRLRLGWDITDALTVPVWGRPKDAPPTLDSLAKSLGINNRQRMHQILKRAGLVGDTVKPDWKYISRHGLLEYAKSMLGIDLQC